MKIFGREPALFAKLAAAVIMLVSIYVTHWAPGTQALVDAAVLAVAGFVVAWKVVGEKALAGLSGVAGAVLSAAMNLGFHMSSEQQAGILSAITVGVAFWLRGQVQAPIDVYGNEVPAANTTLPVSKLGDDANGVS